MSDHTAEPSDRGRRTYDEDLNCPLCAAISAPYLQDERRTYRQCSVCRLVFVVNSDLPSREVERRQYDLHENDPGDENYRRFLSRVFRPLHERLPPRSCGLDFGCGPGPTLSVMFEEAGHTMDVFDPFYFPNRSVLEQQYDFVTASEVVEHFHRPAEEFARLFSLLKPGGLLGLMTKRVRDRDAFAKWHYKQDPTHVCFYSAATFEWLAEDRGARFDVICDDVVIFRLS
ncbi:class I SAM-dependent methyltransferase [Stratiformator vulcanicus]|uniref:Methyltransferase domain protein n=1 Tax=Stratiformator vulcanicus TaxID=2527980 RepID=A0A517R727_9PLAN|nr:class I SAM-dependent methyltransferase [Stratiformator vulcanicus]QDT39688.1 Methyltransferase domain protein [Stratiformator vulcanicus]